MTAFRTLIIASILSSMPAGAVLAQPDRTGTGSGPLSTEKGPNTTVTEQTKPPSRDASPTSHTPIERLTPRQAADDAIAQRVCIGCASKPNEIRALTVPVPIVDRPEKRDVTLDELHSASPPKQQTSLDTIALASAHREHAKSMEEKTNGLWQSWLVSVCDGCGDQRPPQKIEDWPVHDVSLTTVSLKKKSPLGKDSRTEVKQTGALRYGSLEANLSPENISSIRKMPQ